jgi:hypothetical protein
MLARVILLLLLVFTAAVSAEGATSCYRIEMPAPFTSALEVSRTEVWCYRSVDFPAGSVYIYNADAERVRPELAMLVEPDGMITHGSLLADEITVHRVHSSQINPYTVPLQEPTNVAPLLMYKDAPFAESAERVFSFLFSESPEFEDLAIQVGHFTASADHKPWRGYWWPYKGQPLSGTSSSPLAKYDRFVQARTGANPGAAAWENSHHRYSGVWWEGHCNGWAGSSILRRQPSSTKTDARSGVSFTVADQKGILAEMDYCVSSAFFGNRYRSGRDNISDIDAALFHRTITYYLGRLGKPIATDYRRDAVVDNHSFSGYSMDITQSGPQTYSVKTTLTMHKYDGSRSNTPGTAPTYSKTYRYTLREGANGSISGSWAGDNPDFLWVPLSLTDCSKNNPGLNSARVNEILGL